MYYDPLAPTKSPMAPLYRTAKVASSNETNLESPRYLHEVKNGERGGKSSHRSRRLVFARGLLTRNPDTVVLS